MKPYKSSNKMGKSALQKLILYSLLGGLLVGGITFIVSRLIYLLIIFPGAMGIGGGIATRMGVKSGKVRNPLVAGLFGALSGVVIYGTLFAGEYWAFKQVVSQDIIEQVGELDKTQVEGMIDGYLQEQTGEAGFLGYVKYAAKEGVTIGEIGEGGTTLNETMTWLYWLVEFAIIEGLILFIAVGQAREPFCESSDSWYENYLPLGNVNNSSSEEFIAKVKSDNFFKAGKFINPLEGGENKSLDVKLMHSSDSVSKYFMLVLERVKLSDDGQNTTNKFLQGEISDRQHLDLLKGYDNAFLPEQELNLADRQNLVMARAERSQLNDGDGIKPHDLNAAELANLVEQLSKFPKIKKAYLAQKEVQYLPEKPCYVLGLIYHIPILSNASSLGKEIRELGNKLEVKGQIIAVVLNNNKKLEKSLKQVGGEPIYK